jgi:hypothetical protein
MVIMIYTGIGTRGKIVEARIANEQSTIRSRANSAGTAVLATELGSLAISASKNHENPDQ